MTVQAMPAPLPETASIASRPNQDGASTDPYRGQNSFSAEWQDSLDNQRSEKENGPVNRCPAGKEPEEEQKARDSAQAVTCPPIFRPDVLPLEWRLDWPAAQPAVPETGAAARAASDDTAAAVSFEPPPAPEASGSQTGLAFAARLTYQEEAAVKPEVGQEAPKDEDAAKPKHMPASKSAASVTEPAPGQNDPAPSVDSPNLQPVKSIYTAIEHTPAAPSRIAHAPKAEVHAAPVEAEIAPAPVKPVRMLALQIDGGAESPIQLRVMERGPAVLVDVRTADTSLGRELREGISELSAKLDQKGFRNEIWTPQIFRTAESDLRDPRQAEQDASGHGAYRRDGHHGQPDRRQPGHDERNKPEWVHEMERTIFSLKGATHGEYQ